MKSKLKDLHDGDAVRMFRAYSSGGSIPRKDFIRGIKKYLDCTDPTANKVLRKFSPIFIVEDNIVCLREDLVVWEPEDIPELYEKSHLYLDKLTKFLSSRAGVGDFLIKVGTIRREFMDGVFSGLEELLIMLEMKFGDEVKSLVEEGKALRKTAEYKTEDAFSDFGEKEATNEKEAEETKEERRGANTNKVVETL